MQKYTRGVTPIGEALFANLIKPEMFKGKPTGKFTVMLKLAPKEMAKFRTKVLEEFEKFKELPDNDKKKFAGAEDFANGFKEYKDEEYIKFTMPTEINCKSGEVIQMHVPIFDASKKEISKTLTGVGNGSKIRIAYELRPFHMTKANNGVSLRITGIQIIDLVPYGEATADQLGFEEEDGYEANDTNIPDVAADTDETEGDF